VPGGRRRSHRVPRLNFHGKRRDSTKARKEKKKKTTERQLKTLQNGKENKKKKGNRYFYE